MERRDVLQVGEIIVTNSTEQSFLKTVFAQLVIILLHNLWNINLVNSLVLFS